MKIKPSADFSAIPAEPAIQQAEPDAPAMQAESVRRISVPARSDSRFVQDYASKSFSGITESSSISNPEKQKLRTSVKSSSPHK